MAKIKKTANKQVSKSSDIKSLLKKNEFVIGALTILVLLIVGISAAKTLSSKIVVKNNPAKQQLNLVGTKIQVGQSATPSATPRMNTNANMKQVTGMKNIKNLSNTSSVEYVTVKNGDSYFRITKNYCGSGKNYMLTSELNNNAPLFVGDSVKVSCSY